MHKSGSLKHSKAVRITFGSNGIIVLANTPPFKSSTSTEPFNLNTKHDNRKGEWRVYIIVNLSYGSIYNHYNCMDGSHIREKCVESLCTLCTLDL